jgi:hypothetical protein
MLKQKDERGSLMAIGYAYAEKKQNPSMAEIWIEMVDGSNRDYYVGIEQRAKVLDLSNREKQKIVDQISTIFVEISKGFVLYPVLTQLNHYKFILSKSQGYVDQFEVGNGQDFTEEIKFLEMFLETGYSFTQSLPEYVKEQKIIETLKKEFEAIVSPDKGRTIKDQIQRINEKTEVGEEDNKVLTKLGKENLYHEGFMIAIRGESPTLVALLKHQRNYLFTGFYYQWYPENGFGDNPADNAKEAVRRLALGYGYSYHLRFLEDHLGKVGAPHTSVDRHPSDDHAVKLIWKGQKNQLYDVLRQLKREDLIGNSYEELATFLREHVNIFRDTMLSTVTKEIGKEKRPPKARRVNLQIDKK